MEIQITLTNLTPIFSAAPGTSTISLNGIINPPEGGFPYTRTRTMKMIAQSYDGEKKLAYVPVVPANTMRNLLRRSMLKNILEPSLNGHVQLSVGAYAAAYAGSASGNPDGKPSTFDETVATRNHTFLGLFGGGPRMLEGRIKVDTLYPLHTNASAVVGDGFETELISGDITDSVWTRRVDPFTKMVDDNDLALLEGGAESVNEWINEWFINVVDKKKTSKSKDSKSDDKKEDEKEDEKEDKTPRGLNAFNAHEIVVPGVSWVWRITVEQPTDAQTGLILSALSQLNKLRIAGGNSKDYGRFEINTIKLDSKDVWSNGSLIPAMDRYSDALAESLDSMTSEQFEIFAASTKAASKKEE